MNEQRIKYLSGKALDKAVPYTWHNLDHVEVEKVMKEFAELLIKECIMICWAGGESDVLYEKANDIEKAFIDGQDYCVDRLKQQFGIK